MRGIYLSFISISPEMPTGVGKKILAQVKSFNQAGIRCDIFTVKKHNGFLGALLRRLPFFDDYYKWSNYEPFKYSSFIYIRKPSWLTLPILRSLRYIKRINPQIKIIMEIPTYPYDKEFSKKFKDLIFILKDKIYRQKLIGIINRVVTFSHEDNILGIKTIKIKNGIDISTIEKRHPIICSDNTINVCGVAMLAKWHGFDRFIHGLANYYKGGGDRNIVFHIVGSGEEENNLKKIVSDNNLTKNVLFYGFKTGSELEKIYNLSDLAVDLLGMSRHNIKYSSSLKSREYLAKGLPIISGVPIDVLTDNFIYFYKVSCNESPIIINCIINFYNTVYSSNSKREIVSTIREYAEKTCDINITFLPVINYLKNNTQ